MYMFLRFKRLLSETLSVEESRLPDRLVDKALTDTLFFNTLIANRENPAFISAIIEREWSEADYNRHKTEYYLILKGIKSLLKWSAFGFGKVSRELFKKRIGFCKMCPNLSKAKGILYSISGASNSHICNICGCPINRKAMLPTEQCPDIVSYNPPLTRWNEEPY